MDRINVAPLTGSFAATSETIDLSSGLSPNLAKSLQQSLLENLVLVLPQQSLSPDEHVELGQCFGELEPRHPLYPTVSGRDHIMVIENGPNRPPDNEMWHADMTFRPDPPHCSLLQAQELPPKGGDTMFANMYAVYDDLSSPMAKFLSELTAIHDVRKGFSEIFDRNGEADRAKAMEEMHSDECRVTHPVIGKHPVTGRHYLNVNETFTTQIVGLAEDESRALLAMLVELVRLPRYQVRHRWSVGDLVIWDNLATQHFAIGDYSEYRRMHRVTVRTFDVEQSALSDS